MKAPNVAGAPSVSESVAGTVPPTPPSTAVSLPTWTAALAAASASGVLAWPGVAPPSGMSPALAVPRSSTPVCGAQPPLDAMLTVSTLWPETLTTAPAPASEPL